MKYTKNFQLPSNIFIEGKQCDFYWCSFCKVVALHFPCCNNSSCNCSGCEHCMKIDLEQVQFPTKEQLIETKRYLTEKDIEEINLLNDIFDIIEIFDD